MIRSLTQSATLLLLISVQLSSWAQNKVEFLGSEFINRNPRIVDAQRLIGDVRLKYREALMFCDSAYRYKNDDFEAFSNVRILQGDTLSLLGDHLFINQKSKIAQFRSNITMKDHNMVLSTERLDYNMDSGMANYYNGGTIVNNTSNNTLTSQKGYYDSENEFFFFRDDVKLVNPNFSIDCDTLKYSTRSEIAWFVGPSHIQSENSNIYCENGWYDTTSDKCQFNNNAEITTGSTLLKGDSISYDAKLGAGQVFCNVLIQDTSSHYIITGDFGRHNEKTGNSLVTDCAMMIQIFDDDSLFLRADTLKSRTDSLNRKKILAYNHVRFYKTDLQGVADSLVYSDFDSLLVMFNHPIIWSEKNQITGDTISLKLAQGQLSQMLVRREAFIISWVTDSAFNQIKGRSLIGYFNNNQLVRIDIDGNGQAIYYPKEEDNSNLIGMNKAECSNISITIIDNSITRISLIKSAEGGLYPLKIVDDSDKWLEGFSWEIHLKPSSPEDLFPK